MRFWKYHGLGNDFVVVDGFTDPAQVQRDWAALTRRVCARHTGVGADGILLVTQPSVAGAQVRMRVFNADGSEPEMCGNGVRCVARFARDRLGVTASPLRVQTGTGEARVVDVTPDGAQGFTVDMGLTRVGAEHLGLDREHAKSLPNGRDRWRIAVEGREFEFAPVSVGNPHAVIVLDERTPNVDLKQFGPLIERHPAFPQRTNVHTARVSARNAVTLHTWERGAGLTQACGSGACAAVAATVHLGLTDRRVRVTLPGGDLLIELDEHGRALMTGPAEEVFAGEWRDSSPTR